MIIIIIVVSSASLCKYSLARKLSVKPSKKCQNVKPNSSQPHDFQKCQTRLIWHYKRQQRCVAVPSNDQRGRVTSVVRCLTDFTPEICGFRHNSAANVKNTADHCKLQNSWQIPKFMASVNSIVLWSSHSDYRNYYCHLLRHCCSQSSAFYCLCFMTKLCSVIVVLNRQLVIACVS